MRYFILTLSFLFLIFKPFYYAFAEWTMIDKSSNGVVNYVDLKNIGIGEKYIYVWDLRDEAKPVAGKYLSSSVLYEVDCNVPRAKTLTYVWYTGNMGIGKNKQEESVVKDWKYPTPATYMYSVLKSACKKIRD